MMNVTFYIYKPYDPGRDWIDEGFPHQSLQSFNISVSLSIPNIKQKA